jgi:hypothetical protein
MHVFKHPKFYEEYRKRAKLAQKELRDAGNELAKRDAVKEDLARPGSSPARNKSDQAISKRQPTGESERASWSGPQASDSTMVKQRASSSTSRDQKLQAPSVKLSNQPEQASSDKRQAPSSKRQA